MQADDPGSDVPAPPRIPDGRRTHASRVYDYLLGGKDNLEVDRAQVERNLEVNPYAKIRVRASRLFLERGLRYMVAEAGMRQILDIGSGMPLPTYNTVHEIAHSIAPDTRVVYVDSNPVVVAHMGALQTDGERTTAVVGDLRFPRRILDDPDVREFLDLSEPVGVMLGGIVHFLGHGDDAAGVLAALRTGTAPGSHVVLNHISADLDHRVHDVVALFDGSETPMITRTHAEIAELLAGYEVLEPGIVPVHEWRPDGPVDAEGNGFGMVVRSPV
ncbi:SAM-dependent methyltransferase [Streptomyces sp. NPDC051940]|uniref:SAM-dependent methyltransferase n=1 Tax=Streptomyces sp. NPDC051940 TaxID=3155675 RepID=UPI00343AF284